MFNTTYMYCLTICFINFCSINNFSITVGKFVIFFRKIKDQSKIQHSIYQLIHRKSFSVRRLMTAGYYSGPI